MPDGLETIFDLPAKDVIKVAEQKLRRSPMKTRRGISETRDAIGLLNSRKVLYVERYLHVESWRPNTEP